MNSKAKQFIAFGVCSVVALALCLVALVVTVNNLTGEADITENKTVINKTELNSSKETLVEYINKLVIRTEDRFVKTKTYTDVSVNNISISDSSKTKNQDEALINFTKDRMLPAIDKYYAEDFVGSFEKADSKKLSFTLNKNALKNAEFYIGQVDENGESVFDDEGNLVDGEYYYLTYVVDVENKKYEDKLSELLSSEDDLTAKSQFLDAVKNNCRIEHFEAKPQSFEIKAKVNRTYDELQYINVIRNYAVKLDVEFINDADFFGKKEVYFTYTVTDTYEYSYAGISFVEDEITIEYGEEYMLNVNAVIDDDSEYKIEFISSDKSIASVDEMGYVKGLKNINAPTTITVKLNYLGETFTDTCVVNVVKEGLK